MYILVYTLEVLKLIKHDRYVKQLYNRLILEYDEVAEYVLLETSKCTQAEIDLIAFRDDEIHIFEVKCSFRIVKARKQLKRIAKLLKGPVETFFYCGSADKLIKIEQTSAF